MNSLDNLKKKQNEQFVKENEPASLLTKWTWFLIVLRCWELWSHTLLSGIFLENALTLALIIYFFSLIFWRRQINMLICISVLQHSQMTLLMTSPLIQFLHYRWESSSFWFWYFLLCYSISSWDLISFAILFHRIGLINLLLTDMTS